METVKTATGKEFSCEYISTIPYPARAYIRIPNTPLSEIAAVFSDPAETAQLFYCEHCIEGYTRLMSLVNEDNAVRVVLSKQ